MVLKKLLILSFVILLKSQIISAANQKSVDLMTLTPVGSVKPPQSKSEVLVYFWASWCPDCKSKLTNEFKNNTLYEKYDVYLVSTDKDKKKVEHFSQKHELAPYVYTDTDKSLQNALNVFSVPTIVKFLRTPTGLKLLESQSGGDMSRFIK